MASTEYAGELERPRRHAARRSGRALAIEALGLLTAQVLLVAAVLVNSAPPALPEPGRAVAARASAR